MTRKKSVLSGLSRDLNQAGRVTRDLNALNKTAVSGSLKPVEKRAANKVIGRLLSRLWVR